MNAPIVIYQNIMSSISLIIAILLSIVLLGCQEKDKHSEGRELAKIHCAACHLYPEPSTLPRKIWGDKIIPNMGLKMGMSHGPLYTYSDKNNTSNISPTMAQEDWNKIVHFYLNTSKSTNSVYSNPNFKASKVFFPHIFSNDSIPLITMTSFNEEKRKLLVGESKTTSLLTLGSDGKIIESKKLDSPPVKFSSKDSLDYILTIGSLGPSDKAEGNLYVGNHSINNLTRPVDFLIKDVNSDGYDDVFICNYGNTIGDFSLFENKKNGTYEKKVIHPISGAIKVESVNIDEDLEEELIVLFAQEHEYIMIWDYSNNTFNGSRVMQFQPTFGAVDFQLEDIDNDGDKDIIIANGDNSDFSLVLKNFHGIRVFINEGNKKFSESYFHPMHGVSKLAVEDFDLDGDMDILGISNFGNITDPNFKSVQLLINEGNLNFTPKCINKLPEFRWQTMDVSDYDNDGDIDVFLGSFNLNIGPKESDVSNLKNVSWVKLENKTH